MFADSDTLSQLSNRLEAAEQELINAKLDEKLAMINSARISQVSFKKLKIILYIWRNQNINSSTAFVAKKFVYFISYDDQREIRDLNKLSPRPLYSISLILDILL